MKYFLMKKTALLALMLCSLASGAQFSKLVVEEVDNSGSVKGRTYRIYVELQNDSDQVNMVFGDETHALEIKATKPFYQSEYGGALSVEVNKKLAKDKPGVRYDSWLTIGATDNYNNFTTNFLLTLEDFEKSGAGFKTKNGAWFCTPGSAQAYGGKSRRVLIGQFTSEGVITGVVSLMGRNAKGETWYSYDQTFTTAQ